MISISTSYYQFFLILKSLIKAKKKYQLMMKLKSMEILMMIK